MNADGTFTAAELRAAQDSVRRLAKACEDVGRGIEIHVRRPLAARNDTDEFALTLRASVVRMYGWCHTLSKCESTDFQAAGAGARASFEILADVATLVAAPDRLQQMIAWETSAKLKLMESIERSSPTDTGPSADARRKFMREHAANVAADRLGFWPDRKNPAKGRHPERWTGRSLFESLQEARAAVGESVLNQFKQIQTHLNWLTHGSSLVLVRGSPTRLFFSASRMAAGTVAANALHVWRLVLDVAHRCETVEARKARESLWLTLHAATSQIVSNAEQ